MSNIDRGLHKLMRINRGRFGGGIIPPEIPTENPDTPPATIIYTAADFGENAINNHYPGAESHSKHVNDIFNYVTRNFRDRCTSYESYKTTMLGNGMINSHSVLKYCKIANADIIMTPYFGAGAGMNYDYEGFVISVASHYNNDGSYDTPVGDDNNRHDITPNAETFLEHSIAVSARSDTPSTFKNSTSEGFGMEFFEDASPGLDAEYPDKDLDDPFAELLSDNGTIVYSNVHSEFSRYIEVGEKITIRHSSDEATWEDTFVTSIIDDNHITVSPLITPITIGNVYGWHKTTLGRFIQGNNQSYAIPIVAGKLKIIKMTTGADWATVRAAARATAKRNPTGIPEIDNANWDIYRGFGSIQVQDAIDYINNND